MKSVIHGQVDRRVAAELRHLGHVRDCFLETEQWDRALETIDLYNRVYARWYYDTERTNPETHN